MYFLPFPNLQLEILHVKFISLLITHTWNGEEAHSFFSKMGRRRPLFHLFSSFQTHIHNFFKSILKMSIQYTVQGFKLTTFGT